MGGCPQGVPAKSEFKNIIETQCLKNILFQREGYPDDIANAIYFLSSDKSSFITGVMLKLDGGFMDAARLAWA